jgi:hypothetical protein
MGDEVIINVEQTDADETADETAPVESSAGPGVESELEAGHAVAISEETKETAEIAALVATEAAEAALRSTEEVQRLREDARDARWQNLQNKLDQILDLLTEPVPEPETAPEAEQLTIITPEAETSPSSDDDGSGPRRNKTRKRRLWK